MIKPQVVKQTWHEHSNLIFLLKPQFILGCKQGKVDKKSSLFKIQLKNETIFDMDIRK
jgi:hypothetical protein